MYYENLCVFGECHFIGGVMKKMLLNEKGSILVMAAAIVLAIISAVSAWSLVGMVSNSEIQTQYDHDAIQEELLLRSEALRSHYAIEQNSTYPPPPREVSILDETGGRQTVYEIKNKKEQRFVTIFLGQAGEQAIAVKSFIEAKRGRPRSILYTSPVKRLTERLIRNESLAQYQYFSNFEKSENEEGNPNELVKFWGPDVLNGPVHSNDDIYIQHAGGGNNNNRPTFYSMVTTAGRAREFGSNQPYKEAYPTTWQEVFRGGLQESIDNVQEIIFNPDAEELKANAQWVGNGHDIVYAKINGGAIQLMYGDIVSLGTQEFEVYSWYPANHDEVMDVIDNGGNWFEDTDNIWTNEIVIYDTIWTDGGALSAGASSAYWVNDAELWIEGNISNKMTWGCADTIFITNDITYTNTTIGDWPDGFTGQYDPQTNEPIYNPENANPSDFFGLVSEQKIIIRYKHRDPFEDFVKQDWNCNGVYIYGAYAAMAEGDIGLYGNEACHYDGIFTFQYHHWHGSTPSFDSISPYTGNDTTYTYIDLHKYIFPPSISYSPPALNGFKLHGNNPVPAYGTCGYPSESIAYATSYPNNGPNYAVPYGTDYPWYNPVWPESAEDLVGERGTLHIYGAIAQRRRGYIHRSGTDPFNHPNNEWDIQDYHYDGTHSLNGAGTGYDKDYSYDNRLLYVQPPYYPQVYEGWGEVTTSSFSRKAWSYKSPGDW